ncbi:MAG: hypothetical protein MdMp014T_1282 [Treponematales bacterium]
MKKETFAILLPYQKKWIADTAGVKVWEKLRRIGASYVEVLTSVIEAAKSKKAGGQSSYYLSYSTKGEVFNIRPHLDMKTADGSIQIGWLASQTDMLADDWRVVEA